MNVIRPAGLTVRQSVAARRFAPAGKLLRALSVATAVLFFQFAPVRALAQFGLWTAAPQAPLPAVVRVISPERDGASLGSGTLVDVSATHGLVLTNWHVVRDAAGNVIVSFPDGFQSPGYVIKTDRDWDLAAVAIWRPHVAPVPISAQAPQPGEVLTIAGYGPGPYRAISGPCNEYLSPGPGFPYEIVELHAAARHGDSGGPILNSRGELAGVLFGEGGGDTSGSYCGRVRMFLDSIGGSSPPMFASASRPLSNIPGQRILLAQPTPSPPVVPALPSANASAARWPVTTNYPPISLPIGTMNQRPAATQEVATTLPPPPLPESAESAAELPRANPHCAGPLAAIISPLPPMPAGAAKTIDQPVEISWEQIAGHTFGDQFKTIAAGLGAVFVLLQIVRKLV
jgi:serine protease Do